MAFKFVDDLPSEREFEAAMQRATQKAARAALKRAQKNAPVATGHLRDSGEVNQAHSPRAGVVENSVDFTADYASFVEEGHFNVRAGRFVAGQPFLANALKQSEDDLDDEAARQLRKLGASQVRRF